MELSRRKELRLDSALVSLESLLRDGMVGVERGVGETDEKSCEGGEVRGEDWIEATLLIFTFKKERPT